MVQARDPGLALQVLHLLALELRALELRALELLAVAQEQEATVASLVCLAW